MRIKKVIMILLLIVLAVFMTACKADEQKPAAVSSTVEKGQTVYPLTIVDSYNRTVVLEKKPERIVSISPTLTETLCALGQEAKIVGRTDYCDYPETIKKVESIGELMAPNVEKIVELKPDLVLTSTFVNEETVKSMETVGLKVVSIYGEDSFQNAYDSIERVGLLTDSNNKAKIMIDGMKAKVELVQNKIKNKAKTSIYYVVDYGKAGDFTAGGDTFIGKIIDIAGGQNIAEDVKGWSFSLEKLIEKDPNVIICSKYYGAKQGFSSLKGYKELSAVKNGKVFEIDNNMLDRQGPRIADGLLTVAKILHPEAFTQ